MLSIPTLSNSLSTPTISSESRDNIYDDDRDIIFCSIPTYYSSQTTLDDERDDITIEDDDVENNYNYGFMDVDINSDITLDEYEPLTKNDPMESDYAWAAFVPLNNETRVNIGPLYITGNYSIFGNRKNDETYYYIPSPHVIHFVVSRDLEHGVEVTNFSDMTLYITKLSMTENYKTTGKKSIETKEVHKNDRIELLYNSHFYLDLINFKAKFIFIKVKRRNCDCDRLFDLLQSQDDNILQRLDTLRTNTINTISNRFSDTKTSSSSSDRSVSDEPMTSTTSQTRTSIFDRLGTISEPTTPNTPSYFYSEALSIAPQREPWQCHNHFVFCELLGFGGYGRVYHVVSISTGVEYALKENRDRKSSLEWEARILSDIGRHDHIVNFYNAFGYIGKPNQYILMELCVFGSVQDIMTSGGFKFNNENVLTLMYQMISALNHIHRLGVIHLDLKPENILVTSLDPLYFKLSDFGLSEYAIDKPTECYGTVNYMSPEVIEDGVEYDIRADWWSLGVTVAECALGYNPFYDNHKARYEDDILWQLQLNKMICEEIDAGKAEWLKELPFEVKEFILNVIKLNPCDRIWFSYPY